MENRLEALLMGGKKGNQCYINEPLDGPIDLFSLHDSDVEELHFVDGTISQLENLPRGVKKIVINGNKLKEIPRLPNLVHLEANDNELTHVNLKDLNNLVSLYLNNNRINDIQNIPDHIHNTSIDGDGRISTTFYDAASYDDPQTSTINGGSPDLITWAQTFDGGNPSSEFN
jgi:hypothetical protein